MRRNAAQLSAPQGIAIRCLTAGKDDAVVAQLLAMEKKLWKKSDSWGPMLEKELQRRNTFTLYAIPSPESQSPAAAASAGDVIGYILFSATGLVAHISKVLVAPHSRRLGIGRALVQAALQIAEKERRVGSVTLHVDAGNAPALALYTNLGFQSEGTLEASL